MNNRKMFCYRMFSILEPFVLLKRCEARPATLNTSDSEENQRESVRSLALKGNTGRSATEAHTCCFCQKVLCDRNVLRIHLNSVHLRTKKMWCDHCPKFYFTKSAISSHVQWHCKKEFRCNICDYKAVAKRFLEIHIATHTKSVKCPICYKPVGSLTGHMRRHSSKVSCSICQRVVIQCNLKPHMMTHVTKIRRCDVCDEAFSNGNDLRW